MVRVKALLDATMPVIERRSALLQAELAERQRSAAAVDTVRSELASEPRSARPAPPALCRAGGHGGRAGSAASLARRSAPATGCLRATRRWRLASSEADSADAPRGLWRRRLAELDFAPARPMRGDSALPPTDFAYSLPVSAPLVDGLGSVSRAGIVIARPAIRHAARRRGDRSRRRQDRLRGAVPRAGRHGHHRPWRRLDQPVAGRGQRQTEAEPRSAAASFWAARWARSAWNCGENGVPDFARLNRSFICSAVKWRRQPLNCDATH